MGPLLASVPAQDPWATEFLQTLVSGLGKSRSIERLRQLEQHVGKHPALEALCARLEDRLRMSCPRCQVELRRPKMIRHLWEEHRLVLDGRRAGVRIVSVRFFFDDGQLARVDRIAPYRVTYHLTFPPLSRHVAAARVTYPFAGKIRHTTIGRMIVMCP
jgi:hypothetical protein